MGQDWTNSPMDIVLSSPLTCKHTQIHRVRENLGFEGKSGEGVASTRLIHDIKAHLGTDSCVGFKFGFACLSLFMLQVLDLAQIYFRLRESLGLSANIEPSHAKLIVIGWKLMMRFICFAVDLLKGRIQ